MTKRELIEALEALDCREDTKVLLKHKRFGLIDLSSVKLKNVVFNYRPNVPEFGQHEVSTVFEEDTLRSYGQQTAILLK